MGQFEQNSCFFVHLFREFSILELLFCLHGDEFDTGLCRVSLTHDFEKLIQIIDQSNPLILVFFQRLKVLFPRLFQLLFKRGLNHFFHVRKK